MKLFTIGFTKKNGEAFFTKLKKAGVRRIIDVRLNNQSQLAGYAKRDDLRYFLKEIGNIEYIHLPELAPSQEIFDKYGKGKESWKEWEQDILNLLAARKLEKTLDPALFEGACLLCSEHDPTHCHRRVIAEYLKNKWGNIEIEHLM
jgi:uncharacterized protein (DUF488 family)